MRSMFRATALGLVFLAVTGAAQAQQASTKIAYINSQALMDVAPGRAAADSALTKLGEGFRATLAKLQDSAQTMLTNYQKNEPKLTAAAKDKAQKDLTAIETELQTKQQQFQQQFQAKQQELLAPITDAVKQVIDDIRIEGGYAMILDNAPGQSNIVAADKNLDITDKVVSRLRATPAPKVKANEPAKAEPAKGAPTAPAGVTRPPTRPPTQ
ncbi:MAG TPA: OmpH family outer membrane protein [Gemmatimonadaceae bacterium]